MYDTYVEQFVHAMPGMLEYAYVMPPPGTICFFFFSLYATTAVYISETLMYHAACKVEFQPFNQLYSQLTFFILLLVCECAWHHHTRRREMANRLPLSTLGLPDPLPPVTDHNI